ncbi:hypothetical protein D3C72_1595870 [compost metagenome]
MVRFHQGARARERGGNRACHGGAARRAVANPDDALAACALQGYRVTVDPVAVGRELHAGRANCARCSVNRHGSSPALKHRKGGLGLERAIERAIDTGPVAAIGSPQACAAVDHAIEMTRRVAAIPEA